MRIALNRQLLTHNLSLHFDSLSLSAAALNSTSFSSMEKCTCWPIVCLKAPSPAVRANVFLLLSAFAIGNAFSQAQMHYDSIAPIRLSSSMLHASEKTNAKTMCDERVFCISIYACLTRTVARSGEFSPKAVLISDTTVDNDFGGIIALHTNEVQMHFTNVNGAATATRDEPVGNPPRLFCLSEKKDRLSSESRAKLFIFSKKKQ